MLKYKTNSDITPHQLIPLCWREIFEKVNDHIKVKTGKELKRTTTPNEYYGFCPFHHDTNPSFSYNAETTQFRCHASTCQESGNVFQFMKLADSSFNTYDWMCHVAGYQTEKKRPARPRNSAFLGYSIREIKDTYVQPIDDISKQRIKTYFESRNISIDDELIESLKIKAEHTTAMLWIPLVNASGDILRSWYRRLTPDWTKLEGEKGKLSNHKQAIEASTAIRIEGDPKHVSVFEGIEDAITYYYLEGKEKKETILACCSAGNFPKMFDFCQGAESVKLFLDGDLPKGEKDYPCYSAPSVQYASKLVRALRDKDISCNALLPAKPKDDINKAHCEDRAREWLTTLSIVPVETVTDYTLERNTQLDSADKFASIYGDNYRYDAITHSWMILDNNWRKDETEDFISQVSSFIRDLSLANTTEGKNHIKEMRKQSYVSAVASACSNISGLKHSKWDQNVMLLGTPGQTVDLTTGQLRPANPRDYITKQTLVEPKKGTPKKWLQFLNDVTNNDNELIDYLQKLSGYMLTGQTVEHAFVFLYGEGSNGKSTYFETIMKILHDYASMASMGAFMETRNDGGRATPEIMRLEGSRMVVCNEVQEGQYWHESKVKALVSGEPFTGRCLYQEERTFTPTFKVLVVGNHKPNLRNVDYAMKRRLHLVPFTVKIEGHKLDLHLKEKLLSEAPEILNWCVEGCLKWQKEGLKRPESVSSATDCYFDDQDIVKQWQNSCLNIGKGLSATPKQLADSFSEYSGEKVSIKKIAGIMEALCLSGRDIRKNRSNKGVTWQGVTVLNPLVIDYQNNENEDDLPF